MARKRAGDRGGLGAGDEFQERRLDTPEDLDLPMPRGGDVVEGAAAVERQGVSAAKAALSWLQHETLRIVSERREVRRRDIIARCGISTELARRTLAGLVGLGLLRRVGHGRGTRYVTLSPS